jgi:hypothetical protein
VFRDLAIFFTVHGGIDLPRVDCRMFIKALGSLVIADRGWEKTEQCVRAEPWG